MPRPDPLPRRKRTVPSVKEILDRARRIHGRGKRRPPESGVPQPAEPPRGPWPLQGGAEAPLD